MGGVGGLLCLWNNNSLEVKNHFIWEGYIGMDGKWKYRRCLVTIVNFYSPCELEKKKLQ